MAAAGRPPAGPRTRRRAAEPSSGRGERPARRSRSSRSGEPGGSRRGSDLLARGLGGVPGAGPAIVFVDLGGTAWAILMIAVAIACLFELYTLLARWRPASVVG